MAEKTAIRLREALTGILCLYKPPDVSMRYVKETFRTRIAKELNDLYEPPTLAYLDVTKKDEKRLFINVRPSYSNSPLALGPRYEPRDIMVCSSRAFGYKTSGVCGLETGQHLVRLLDGYNLTKAIQIKGKLGEATEGYYKDQKVVGKATYNRIDRNTFNKVLASFEAAHQRKLFIDCGIQIQSQEAYELACQGLIRPKGKDIVGIYSLKLIEFTPPDFTIEMICTNVREDYCLQFIHDVGLKLRSLAHCTGMRCIRNGPFTINEALLIKNITIEAVIKNIDNCITLLMDSKLHDLLHIQFPKGDLKWNQKQ